MSASWEFPSQVRPDFSFQIVTGGLASRSQRRPKGARNLSPTRRKKPLEERWYKMHPRLLAGAEHSAWTPMSKESEEAFSILERVAMNAGACSFGVASVEEMRSRSSRLPAAEELARSRHAISIGCRLSDSIMESLVDGPSKLYAYHYRVVNKELDAIALRVANEIQKMGCDACPIPSSQILDWNLNVGHASHRWAAYHAGLGWYGRNNLIVSPQFGARVRYVTIFTDLPLPEGRALGQDCGDCRACISACPAGAILESRGDFDLGRCQEQLQVYKTQWNIGHHICGLCIKACPGRKSRRTTVSSE